MWAAEARLIYLNLLLKQKPEELQASLERGLEAQAYMLSSDLRHHPGAEWFLWKTRDYCRVRSNSVPVGVWRYFDGLAEEKPWPQTLYYRGN